MHFDPYASGVLDKEHHDRLVANLPGYARDAGIQPHWITRKLADTCGKAEVDYVRKFNIHRAECVIQGLCFVRSTPDADPYDRMAAIAGALVRNFVRARVMSLTTVADLLWNREEIVATALLIPNFYLSQDEGAGSLAKVHVQSLYDLLLQRGQGGLQTVIYATSLTGMAKEYGTAFSRLVDGHFLKVEI